MITDKTGSDDFERYFIKVLGAYSQFDSDCQKVIDLKFGEFKRLLAERIAEACVQKIKRGSQ